MIVDIRPHTPGEDVEAFIDAGHVVFSDDPAWVAPLRFELRNRLNPKKNSFFDQAEAQLWTAWRNGKLVGRCSAQIDQLHLQQTGQKQGFFGFFDTLDDQQVADELLGAAAAWLRQRGMTSMVGPFSLSFKEEFGVLVDGFEHPPMIVMGHSRAYQDRLAQAAGLQKAKDWFAWRYDVGNIPARAERAWEQVHKLTEVNMRTIDRRHFKRDLAILMDIFNDAWSNNWGFVPATDRDVEHMVKELRWILDEDLSLIVEIDGQPMAMCVAVPNLNEAIADFAGRLGPWQLLQLLWRVRVKRPKTARLMLLGIRRELRGIKRYGGLSTAMYVEIAKKGPPKGLEWGELSLTLEDNHLVNLGTRAMGAKIYKTYRIYEQQLR